MEYRIRLRVEVCTRKRDRHAGRDWVEQPLNVIVEAASAKDAAECFQQSLQKVLDRYIERENRGD